MTAWVRSTLGFQPAIVPSSVANRKKAGPDLPFSEIVKSGEAGSKVLNAWPVGDPTAGVRVSFDTEALPDLRFEECGPTSQGLTGVV